MKKWPALWQLVEQGSLLALDYALAEQADAEQEASLLALLMVSHRMGHICLKMENGALEPPLDLPPSLLEKVIEWIQSRESSRWAIREDQRVYLPIMHQIEKTFVEQLQRLLSLPKKTASAAQHSASLTDEQKAAVQHALECPLSLIAGGPGTGKSYTAVQIAEAFQKQGQTALLLAAPTGKAAANLQKRLPGVECKTLHSLLEIRSPQDFQKTPPWIHLDLVLVDECSMIDTALFARLLHSIREETHLVLMGDPHQLPPVEGGSFFADLVASNSAPTTFLTKPHRFAKKELIDLSQTILAGKIDQMETLPIPTEKEWLWQWAKERFPSPSRFEPQLPQEWNRARLLTALRKGPLGVEELNGWLYSRFLAQGKGGDYFPVPILILKNDPRTGLNNGEMGWLIQKIGSKEEEYACFDEGRRWPRSQLPSFEYAYASTVHKSQGSEYHEVLVIVPEGSEAFGRELLYTAATRAKESIQIVGERARIQKMLDQRSGKISGVREKMEAWSTVSSS